jgi:hypothetical protein
MYQRGDHKSDQCLKLSEKNKDTVYFLNPRTRSYEVLTISILTEIERGAIVL